MESCQSNYSFILLTIVRSHCLVFFFFFWLSRSHCPVQSNVVCPLMMAGSIWNKCTWLCNLHLSRPVVHKPNKFIFTKLSHLAFSWKHEWSHEETTTENMLKFITELWNYIIIQANGDFDSFKQKANERHKN